MKRFDLVQDNALSIIASVPFKVSYMHYTQWHVPLAFYFPMFKGSEKPICKHRSLTIISSIPQVDIRIEEGWEREAFEHRAWKNWDWLREHYGGERHSETAGNNQIQLGFEPTLRHMIAEMLKSGKTTPDEISAALQALLRKGEVLRIGKDVIKKDRKRIAENAPSQNEITLSNRSGAVHAGREQVTRNDKQKELQTPNRRRIEWRQGRAPWAPKVSPWHRHNRLMSEFENPEDSELSKIPRHGIEDRQRGRDLFSPISENKRDKTRDVRRNTGTRREKYIEKESTNGARNTPGASKWFVRGRPMKRNEDRLRPVIEATIKRGTSYRRSADYWQGKLLDDKPYHQKVIKRRPFGPKTYLFSS